jgi:hypothetical protein
MSTQTLVLKVPAEKLEDVVKKYTSMGAQIQIEKTKQSDEFFTVRVTVPAEA